MNLFMKIKKLFWSFMKRKSKCQKTENEVEKNSGEVSVESLKKELDSLSARLKALQKIALKALSLHSAMRSTYKPSRKLHLKLVPSVEKDKS